MGMGQVLKKVLSDRNMTIKELSELTGISKNTLYAITKRDSLHVRAETIEKISQALNMPIAALLDWNSDGKMSEIDRIAYQTAKSRDVPITVQNAPVYTDDVIESLANAIQEDNPWLYKSTPDSELIQHYNDLNPTGKAEAIKRVEELTHIDKYTKKEPSK